MFRVKIVEFFCYFLEDVDKEINSMKINVNSRARYSAEEFLKQVSASYFTKLAIVYFLNTHTHHHQPIAYWTCIVVIKTFNIYENSYDLIYFILFLSKQLTGIKSKLVNENMF